jgi:2-keto-3-deoxy-6-phosphogluconate aldolase
VHATRTRDARGGGGCRLVEVGAEGEEAGEVVRRRRRAEAECAEEPGGVLNTLAAAKLISQDAANPLTTW